MYCRSAALSTLPCFSRKSKAEVTSLRDSPLGFSSAQMLVRRHGSPFSWRRVTTLNTSTTHGGVSFSIRNFTVHVVDSFDSDPSRRQLILRITPVSSQILIVECQFTFLTLVVCPYSEADPIHPWEGLLSEKKAGEPLQPTSETRPLT